MNYEKKPFEACPGDRVLQIFGLNGGDRLVRLVNRVGERYSVLVDRDGLEYASTPTISESRMLRYFRKEIR